MACFIVPATEAVIVTVATKVMKAKGGDAPAVKNGSDAEANKGKGVPKSPFLRKLKWLNYMLWGGSFLLAFEHVWHGEVTPWFPFLTAASNPADAAEMLHEMATSGVWMAVLVTAVWVGMVLVTNMLEKRTVPAASAAN